MRKVPFIKGEYYHIYSRTLMGVPMFQDPIVARRLKMSFLASNSTNSTKAFRYLRANRLLDVSNFLKIVNEGNKIVDVLCYSIMPDHYHLLVKETEDGGITKFISRVNISVSKYINIKSDRRGPIFESRFKSSHIDSNDYLLHLSLYIHLNPLDFLIGKKWRDHSLKNWPKAKDKLLNYKYSSVSFFLREDKIDPIISGTGIIFNQFKDREEYESFLKNWSKEDVATP